MKELKKSQKEAIIWKITTNLREYYNNLYKEVENTYKFTDEEKLAIGTLEKLRDAAKVLSDLIETAKELTSGLYLRGVSEFDKVDQYKHNLYKQEVNRRLREKCPEFADNFICGSMAGVLTHELELACLDDNEAIEAFIAKYTF